jgi:hypothetical protein
MGIFFFFKNQCCKKITIYGWMHIITYNVTVLADKSIKLTRHSIRVHFFFWRTHV